MFVYSRPQKFSHLDTIQYEIDMLNHCHRKLLNEKWEETPDNYIALECFLLHYRNLIEFFGDSEDLRVSEWKVWSPKLLSKEELASISDKKPFQEYRGLISQYLQHCTKGRTIDRSWDVKQMYAGLKEVLQNFRRLFPVQPFAKPVATLAHDVYSSFSTATITVCDSGADLDSLNFPRIKEIKKSK